MNAFFSVVFPVRLHVFRCLTELGHHHSPRGHSPLIPASLALLSCRGRAKCEAMCEAALVSRLPTSRQQYVCLFVDSGTADKVQHGEPEYDWARVQKMPGKQQWRNDIQIWRHWKTCRCELAQLFVAGTLLQHVNIENLLQYFLYYLYQKGRLKN